MSELTDQQKGDLRRALGAVRDELVQTLASTADAAAPVDIDEPIGRLSRMDAMQQQNMAAANRRALQTRQQQIAAALVRIEEDEYGDCLGCGEGIDARRLAARPETPFCIACQSKREAQR